MNFIFSVNADVISSTQLDKPTTQDRRQVAMLSVSSNNNYEGFLLARENIVSPAAFGDDYSLAPWLMDNLNQFYYASAIGAPTTHTFDGFDESGGDNFFGSVGGSFFVNEGIIDLGGGVERYLVQVSAVDSSLNNEPWVDASWAGQGFTDWILDVGTFDGGSNPISPGYNFVVQDSGVFLFDSAENQVGVFAIGDTSDATTLSGYSWIGADEDIAGRDVSTFQIYWDIVPASVDADLDLQLVDVTDGIYAPGDTIEILNYTENIGGSTSTDYTISYYASTDTTITDADISLGAEPTRDPLDPGSYDYYLTTTGLPGDLATGEYYVGAILTVTDADANNNVNHDAVPITVSNEPEIEISPLSLDFVQEAAGLAAIQALPMPINRHSKISQESMTKLTHKLKNSSRVNLIVGLNLSVQLEGKLSASQVAQQHRGIDTQSKLLANELNGMNAQIKRQFATVPFMALSADQDTLDFLLRSPQVASITEDKISKPYMASSNLVIGSPLAWAEGYDGNDWAVAVLDTGVDNTHSWFNTPTSKVVAEACYSTNDPGFVESWCPGGVNSSIAADSGLNCDLTVSGCDHGTHVAGTVAGNDETGPDYGVARGADIIAMQVFSRFLTEEDCGIGQAPCTASYSSDQIAAMERVLLLSESMNIAAINMSLGGGQYFDQTSCDGDNVAVKTAIDNLRSVGIATVIASGNDGWTDSISSPGCISTAISVGATTDGDAIASFSSIYPQIHLLAPGVSIDSSVPGDGVGRKQGTSMATPHIAGAWAVMKQVNPTATVSEVLASLQNSATLVDDLRGSGIETDIPRINLDLALDQPRTTFGIKNSGPVVLSISSIVPATPAAWISSSPETPFDVLPGELVIISVAVDYNLAPEGLVQTRLLVESNDLDESPYPGAVFVNVTKASDSEPEFSSTPVADSTLQFGSIVTGSTSSPFVLSVTNLGTAELTIACHISGPDSDQFNLLVCPGSVLAAESSGISVNCHTDSTGLKQASLDLSTNDADEAAVSYPLTCTGIESPSGGFVFSGSFEDTTLSDLVVVNTAVSQNKLTPAQAFIIEATVRNQGDATSVATTLHYYVSDDSVITVGDISLGTDPVPALASNTESIQNLDATAPVDVGTWWVGACVDSVSGESNTVNQCSNGIEILVTPNPIFIVNKVTNPASDSNTKFTFTGNVDAPFLTGGGSSSVSGLPGIFTADETSTAGWALTNISCSGVPAEDITIGATDASVELETGETGSCTFTNTELGSITIVKATVGGVGAFTFTGTDVDNAAGIITSPFVLSTDIDDDDTNSVTFSGLLPGQYLFSEVIPSGWTINGTLGDIVCSGQTSSVATPGNDSLDLNLTAGEDLECTFTNTSSLDSDNDRLSDAAETNTGIYVDSTDTGTDPNNPDSDGDGIKDGDEVFGTLAGLDLPAMGTNPLRKDLLLEYDWFDDNIECGSHTHAPSAASIARVTAAFSDSPVNNPEVTDGVNLISDYGQGGAFTGGNQIDDANGVIAGGVNGTDFKDYKAANFSANRNGYFHYVLLPHRYNTNSSSSGQAEVFGDDLIVSLHCAHSTNNVANTIMHEVGHNLGLHHGGNESCNWKPNYNSVMNYKYQFSGVDDNCTPPGDDVLSYSIGDRISLNENSLNENDGSCGPGKPWDWNGNGLTENPIAFNINEDGGEVANCGGTLTTLNDNNDWDNLFFGGVGDADGAPLVPLEIITEQPVPVEYLNIND